MTYRGHTVLSTLIRCHFSPAETTGGQYLYSGSADGRIHVSGDHMFPLSWPNIYRHYRSGPWTDALYRFLTVHALYL